MRCAPLLKLVMAVGLVLGHSAHADPLQRPARASALAAQRLLLALAPITAEQHVAVGARGHVMLTSNQGAQWAQARVPVSTDLTAVQFVSDQRGYAVGHDGIVLRTDDGGQQWRVVLDGRQVNTLALSQLNPGLPAELHQRLAAELQRNIDVGPNKPWLDLYFSSPDEGWLVGAYNLIFRTQDGGNTWQSWYDKTDNQETLLNLHAIRPHGDTLYVAGEAGLLMRLDRRAQRFVRLDTGYTGSFFGLLDAGERLIAHGMRGNAVVGRDGGQHWQPLTTGLTGSITASTRAHDGSLWMADQMGRITLSRDGGQSFRTLSTQAGMPVTALHIGTRALMLAGPRGVRSLALPKD